MNAIRIARHLDSHELPELIPLIGKHVEIIVLERESIKTKTSNPGGPQPGSAKGKVTMSDDFDAPLEDFAQYMK